MRTIASNFKETEAEFRALMHCAQYTVEQVTGRALYRDGVLPKPSSAVIGLAIKALQAAKKEHR